MITSVPEVAVADARPADLPRGLIWSAGLLLIAGIFFPQDHVVEAITRAGLPSADPSGFILLRAILVTCGALLTVVARYGLATRAVAVAGAVPAHVPLTRREMLLLSCLVLLAAALRIPELGAGLWHDEIATLLQQVRGPTLGVLTSYESQNNHPLYSLLAQLSIAVFGDTPAALRLPALCFGLASIPALYWFARMVTDRREALVAAALLAVSYHHVWFSQNARGYTALLFFALVGTGLLLRLCAPDTPGTGRVSLRSTALAYALLMTLAVYAHLTAAIIVAGHFLSWGIAVARSERIAEAATSAPALGFVLAGLFSTALYAPGLMHIVSDLGGGGPAVDIVWQNPLWMLGETVGGIARGVPGGMVTLALAAAAPIAGVVNFAHRDRLLAGLLLAPVVLTAVIMLGTGHNLWPRFFFFAAGFALLILVRGVYVIATRLWLAHGSAAATVALALLVGASAVLVPSAWGPKQDYQGALDFVRQESASGDAIAAVGIADYAYRSYLAEEWPAIETDSDLARLRATHGRTWLVYSMPELLEARNPSLWNAMQADFREVARYPGTLAGGAIHVMVNR